MSTLSADAVEFASLQLCAAEVIRSIFAAYRGQRLMIAGDVISFVARAALPKRVHRRFTTTRPQVDIQISSALIMQLVQSCAHCRDRQVGRCALEIAVSASNLTHLLCLAADSILTQQCGFIRCCLLLCVLVVGVQEPHEGAATHRSAILQSVARTVRADAGTSVLCCGRKMLAVLGTTFAGPYESCVCKL